MLVIALHVGLVSRGYIGVDIFLALSGFLITALVYEEWEQAGEVSLRRFYSRRVRRLGPALLAVVALFSLVVLLLHPFSGLWPLGKLVGSTLLCVNNWVSTFATGHGQVLGALSPTWTLGQEVQFYLLWPPVLLVLLRAKVRPRVLLALLALAMVVLVCAVPLVSHAAPNYNAYTSPLDRGAELLVGAAAAIAWRNRWLDGPLRAALTRWLLAAGLLYLLISSRVPERWAYLSAAVMAALLIINLIAGSQGVLERLLASSPARFTGKISYGLYLYHLPIYYLLWEWMPRTLALCLRADRLRAQLRCRGLLLAADRIPGRAGRRAPAPHREVAVRAPRLAPAAARWRAAAQAPTAVGSSKRAARPGAFR